MNDKIIAKGEVNIQVFENGKLIETMREKNLVVTLGRTNLAKLLGGDAAGKKIDKVSVGTSAVPAAITDTTITGAFTKAITSVSYPDVNSVMFNFDIDNTEANGITIREFGLLNSDSVLCARKVRTTEIVKTDVIRLVGTWKITVN